MTIKELKTYLDKYPDAEEVRFIAADIKNRIEWMYDHQIDVKNITCGSPIIALELHEGEPMDEEMIQAAEVAERNSMWIPVSEKLPEPGKYVLVSFENFPSTDIGRYEVNDEGDGAWYAGNNDEGDTCCSVGLLVNAWMPLPEPYREEG